MTEFHWAIIGSFLAGGACGMAAMGLWMSAPVARALEAARHTEPKRDRCDGCARAFDGAEDFYADETGVYCADCRPRVDLRA